MHAVDEIRESVKAILLQSVASMRARSSVRSRHLLTTPIWTCSGTFSMKKTDDNNATVPSASSDRTSLHPTCCPCLSKQPPQRTRHLRSGRVTRSTSSVSVNACHAVELLRASRSMLPPDCLDIQLKFIKKKIHIFLVFLEGKDLAVAVT